MHQGFELGRLRSIPNVRESCKLQQSLIHCIKNRYFNWERNNIPIHRDLFSFPYVKPSLLRLDDIDISNEFRLFCPPPLGFEIVLLTKRLDREK